MLGSKCVGDFVEVAIALVRCGEASIDCDDSCGSWHLEFEVRIARNRHKLCERWSPQYSVVLRLLVEHFKLENLLCKVVFAAEDDVELDCPKRGGYFAWNYTMYRSA